MGWTHVVPLLQKLCSWSQTLSTQDSKALVREEHSAVGSQKRVPEPAAIGLGMGIP